MSGPIARRMAEAKAQLIGRKRTPRVFFLSADDYRDFVGTTPDYGWVSFHQLGRPAQLFCPLFEGIAVRQSLAKKPTNKLFCCVGTSVQVPVA